VQNAKAVYEGLLESVQRLQKWRSWERVSGGNQNVDELLAQYGKELNLAVQTLGTVLGEAEGK